MNRMGWLAWLVLGAPWSASPRTQAAPSRDPTRWIALYAGGPSDYTPTYPAYTIEDLFACIAVMDSTGKPVSWLTSGSLFLEIYTSSKHLFATWSTEKSPPANGDDWAAYGDSLTAPGGLLARLDSAVGLVSAALGPLTRPYRVAVMIPYPTAGLDSLSYRGQQYFMGDTPGRAALVAAYVEFITHQLRKHPFPHLAFDGFEWLREDVPAGDSLIVQQVSATVHRAGVRFLWVPYYHPGARLWRNWGFDEAWLQPNYFFHPELPVTHLDSAVAKARAWDMGWEIEFNKNLFSSPVFAARLMPYLNHLAMAPDLRARALVIYDGAGALLMLSRSRDPVLEAEYARLADILRPVAESAQ